VHIDDRPDVLGTDAADGLLLWGGVAGRAPVSGVSAQCSGVR
jgi:hypothetical protein